MFWAKRSEPESLALDPERTCESFPPLPHFMWPTPNLLQVSTEMLLAIAIFPELESTEI